MEKISYAKSRRKVIDYIKNQIKEIDISEISSLFCKYSELKKENVLSFLKDNHDLCIKYLDILLNDFSNDTNGFYYFNSEIKKEILEPFELKSFELIHYFIIFITVKEFNKQLEGMFFDYEKELDDELLRTKTDGNCYYRGQTEDWPIAPSIIRGLKENIKIDVGGLNHLYEENEIENKYKEMLCDYVSSHNVYFKIAFMQHACSYSPFVDLTKKAIVATSFALSNSSQFNKFNSEIACLYKLYIDSNTKIIVSKQKAADFINTIPYFCISINDSFAYGKIYSYNDYSGGAVSVKTFSITTPMRLFNALKPKVVIIDSPTNDRMRYQSGVFAMFYDYISFNGVLKYNYIPNVFLIKKPIYPRSKRKLLKQIHTISDGWYEPDLLINPYEIFNK